MFQKRKKFTEESTPEKRLSDRWDQQIFFISKKYPREAEAGIEKIMKTHAKRQGTKEFMPTEEALTDLTNFYTELQDQF